MRRSGVWGILILAAGAFVSPAKSDSASGSDVVARPSWCQQQSATAYAASDASLSRLRAKLARNEAITIVAIGSSSTEGSDLADRSKAYPTALAGQLGAVLGHGRVRMINAGRGGEAVADTVKRFSGDVIAREPDLVIWQLGANDIARKIDTETVRDGVRDGFAQLRGAGVPVVLMDSQVAPRILVSPVLKATQDMLRQEASAQQALFWSRFDLMTGILASGTVQPADLIKPDDLHMTVDMHACTGISLANAILGRLRPAVQSAQR